MLLYGFRYFLIVNLFLLSVHVQAVVGDEKDTINNQGMELL